METIRYSSKILSYLQTLGVFSRATHAPREKLPFYERELRSTHFGPSYTQRYIPKIFVEVATFLDVTTFHTRKVL